jgi:hypothetical protein
MPIEKLEKVADSLAQSPLKDALQRMSRERRKKPAQ